MSALSIQPTYPIFTETDGQPLENGYIWIGTANLDPQGNPINVYWDAALTQLAGQPIRTQGGYPVNSGTPARLYVNSDYSIRVMNKNGSTVYSAPAATERYNDVVFSNINAQNVTYDPPFTGSQSTTVAQKLSQTVSVLDFGADNTGVADSTADIQSALDSGAKSVYVPSGTYKILGTLTIPKGVSVYGDGVDQSVFDGSNTSYGSLTSGQHIRTAEGTYTQLPDLSVAPSKGDTQLTFASAPSLVTNDVILIYNPTDYSYSGFRSYYRAGEYLRVATVSGNVVTLQGTLADSYAIADVDIYRYDDMTTCVLKDFGLIGLNDLSNPVFGLNLISCVDSVVSNVKVTNCSYTSIGTQRCFNLTLDNCTATENFVTSASGGEYGLAIGNSHVVHVKGGYYASYRHGITTGGGTGIGRVTNRYVVIDGAHVTCNNGVQAMDFHGNTEYSMVTNSTIDGGFSGGGDYLSFTNNFIRANTANGQVAMYMSEMRGLNVLIANNTIENMNYSVGDSRGAFVDFGGNSSAISSSTLRGGGISIQGNKFVWGVDTSNSNGSLVKIINRGYVGSELISVAITNNVVEMLNDVYAEGIQVGAAGAVTTWDSITISDNILDRTSAALISNSTANQFVAKNVYIHNNKSNGNLAGGGAIFVDDVTDLISIKGNTLVNSLLYCIYAQGQSTTSRCKRIHIEGNTTFDGFVSTSSSSSTNADIITGNADIVVVQSNAGGSSNKILTVGSNSGFVVGETITGASSGATATVAYLRSTNQLAVTTSISGSFSAGETITGGTSGATTTFTSEAFTTNYRDSYYNIGKLWQGQNVGVRLSSDYTNNVTTNTPI